MNLIKTLIGIYFNVLSVIMPKLASKQMFFFFCIPFKAKLKPIQQKFLDTAEKKNLKVDGKTVVSYKWGNGPKIVLFVHGWQSHSYRWKTYIDKIDKNKFTIIAFDAPAHGNSEGRYSNVPLFEQAISKVVDEYGLPSTIISHSIGAFSSMYYLDKNKVSIDHFISLATPFTAIQFVHVLQSELKLTDKAVKHMKAYFAFYAGNPPEYFSLDRFADGINARCLLIHDKDDKMTSYENSERLHTLLKDSELVITEGLGHRLRDDTVNNKVRAWIEDKTLDIIQGEQV